jgi:hypothetical protein
VLAVNVPLLIRRHIMLWHGRANFLSDRCITAEVHKNSISRPFSATPPSVLSAATVVSALSSPRSALKIAEEFAGGWRMFQSPILEIRIKG